MKCDEDLGKQMHLARNQTEDYEFLRSCGVCHDEACRRVGADPIKYLATTSKREARAG